MKTTSVQTNFTGGEFTPRLRGRVDIARYQNAAEEIRNAIVMVHGGARRAYGSRFIAEAKNANKLARLIPFVVSRSEAYVLELGDGYFRVFKDRAQIEVASVPYEVTSPYAEAILRDVTYTQGQDSMFLAHESAEVRRIQHYAAASWSMTSVPWVVPPYSIQDVRGNNTCTLSATTVGSGRTFTLAGGIGATVFEPADVGRELVQLNGPGRATLTGYTSSTVATGTITVAFTTSPIAASQWALTEAPKTTCTPSVTGPVGAAITLTLGAAGWKIRDGFSGYVEINGGLVKITGLTSATIADGVVLRALNSTTAAPSEGWSVSYPVWGQWGIADYPRSVMLHEQRLFIGGSPTYPQTIWASGVGLYLDFTKGPGDADAFEFTIGSDQVNHIRHLVSNSDVLLAMTNSGEFAMAGGSDKPIGPNTVQIRAVTPHGCDAARPVRIEGEVLFVQKAAKRLRALGYRVELDRAIASDLSLLAQHLSAPGIIEIAYQREPDPVLWCVLADGGMLTLTYSPEQEITAWTQRPTDGAFESVAVVPTADGEDVYTLVRRTIDGNTVRYVEVFDPTLNTDCSVTGTSVGGAATWTGLDHLEGKIVDVVADGFVMAQQTVTGGQITLPRTANAVEIGLAYSTRIKLLPIELQGLSAQGNMVRVGDCYLRFLETIGCTVDGQQVPFRAFGDSLLDEAPVPFTGEKRVDLQGWERSGGSVTIEQNQPLPFHLLSVVRRVSVNNG